MTQDQWDRVIDIDLKGVWLFNQEAGKHMIQRGHGGSIINMSSIASIVGLTTGNANYSAAKGGVNALTRDLAVEWAKHRIRVNAIAPVQFKTPLVKNLLAQKPETEAYFVNRIPLGRLGEVHEIVGPAVFLASAAASMVTGHILVVDGGNTVAF
jgi:NAD(P)-dependent dehydrogenase (short-subunit alcohol dehydrogenase family)